MHMIPQSLRDSLRDGKVIPFVGAGVSMAVRRRETGNLLFPSWRDLLLGAADRLEQESKGADANFVRASLAIDPPRYLEAACYAGAKLGSTWVEYLKQQLDPRFEEIEPASLALARGLWELGSRLIVTTNYDRVLAWACPEPLARDLGQWDIEAPAEQANFLREGTPDKPTIWHLHGQIRNAAQLILTPDGYQRLYPPSPETKERFAAAQATLRHMLTSRSLLFVGFSFQDAHLGLELRGVQELFEGTSSKHYALVHERDLPLLRSQDVPVELISFRDFGEPLLELVQQLAEIGRTTGGSRTSLAPASSPDANLIGNVASTAKLHEAASYSLENRPFFVPFRPKEDRVIGRERALEQVRRQLTLGKSTSIGQTASFQGIGGLGKTQLAVEYAWRYGDSYPNGVIWIHADQDIDAQLTRLAVEAKWVAPESEHKVKLDIAKHRIRSYSYCLIIFDNVEDFMAIEPYLPSPSVQPHLLATSRTEQPKFASVEIDLLDPEQSLQLLIQEAGRSPEGLEENRAAVKIVENLGRLPLALEMAGAYLRHRHLLTWHQYSEMLELNLRAALRHDLLASFTQHEQDLFATLKIQEDVLSDEPLMRDILDVLTWSSPRSMGLSLLSTIVQADKGILVGALALGLKLRILDGEVDNYRYSLHRLVSRVRREEAALEQRKDWIEHVCSHLGDWFEERRKNFADLPEFEAEIDHLRAWQEIAANLASRQTSRLTWLEAYPSYHRGLYRDAQDRILKAISLFPTGNHPSLEAWLWNDLGIISGLMGEPAKGLEYNQKALAIRLKALGEQHPDTAMSLDNMGNSYYSLGDYHNALESVLKALEIRLTVLGEQHFETASSLAIIGGTYSKLGEHETALEFYLRAFKIRLAVLGEQHPDTAQSLLLIGNSYTSLRDHGKALELKLKALEIVRSTLGDQHPSMAVALNNVGATYFELGDDQKALELALKGLDINLKSLGEEHPETATSFGNAGLCYINLGENKRSIEYLNKSLAVRTKAFGDSHPDTTRAVINLCRSLLRANRRQEAFKLLDAHSRRLPVDYPGLSKLEVLRKELLAKPIRPGFRQPSSKRVKGKRRKH